MQKNSICIVMRRSPRRRDSTTDNREEAVLGMSVMNEHQKHTEVLCTYVCGGMVCCEVRIVVVACGDLMCTYHELV